MKREIVREKTGGWKVMTYRDETGIPEALVDYMVYFHGERDYFECHEVMEEYWKQDLTSASADLWVGLIQLAVAMYHQRRNNLKGAVRMLSSAMEKLDQPDVEAIGISREPFIAILKERLQVLREEPSGSSYTDLNIPLKGELLARSIDKCSQTGNEWCTPSNMQASSLIHKHSMRDRSEVIEARRKALEQKQRSR
ncbi:DUF309 domain-containing protein [Marinicrinis sediminis]|uniref:DUF309 domain-containing protein n=1 Tax=Marinicrinis sediminis TaxID=1652465 RepID=A0ABW5RG44_9BACL